MFKDKKGLILHLVLLGLLMGIGIVFLLGGFFNFGGDVKGQWQLDFLKNNYLEAQKELLKDDVIIKQVGLETARELAANGGYLPGEESNCGKEGDAQVWFKEGKSCFQGVKDAVAELAKKKLDQKMPGYGYSDINFNGPFLSGKGKKGEIGTELATYTFDTDFSVYLGYSFDDYRKIQEEGLRLVSACHGEEKLKECLDKTKFDYWSYGSCGSEKFPDSNSKIIKFCVTSPGLYYIGNELASYQVAFDFS